MHHPADDGESVRDQGMLLLHEVFKVLAENELETTSQARRSPDCIRTGRPSNGGTFSL
jgi:hypothetical protein